VYGFGKKKMHFLKPFALKVFFFLKLQVKISAEILYGKFYTVPKFNKSLLDEIVEFQLKGLAVYKYLLELNLTWQLFY